MARRQTKIDLAEAIRAALDAADALGEWSAAAHLDQALIALVGEGGPCRVAFAGDLDRQEGSS